MSTLSTRKLYPTVLAAVLAVVSLAPAASHAQDQAIGGQVNVPFGFETEYQHFAPGLYSIRMETPNLMIIKGVSNSGFVMTRQDGDAQSATKGKVVFRKRGDKYFLCEVWIAGNSGHQDVIQSKLERQLQMAGDNAAPAGVELAMLESSR